VCPVEKVVCLLEPDEAVRTALTVLLRQRGWQVRIVDKASDLASWLDDHIVNAVITESSLPGMSAEQVLKICRGRNIPALFMGHVSDLEAAVSLMRSGAADFFEKPFDQQRLIQVLNKYA
jgi:two-component system response regulator TtrR